MIEPMILFHLLMAGSLAYGLWAGAKWTDRRLNVWKEAARSCGLQILATAPNQNARGESGPRS